MNFERGKDIKKSLRIGKESLLKRYGIEITEGGGDIPEVFYKKEGNRIIVDIETTTFERSWQLGRNEYEKAFAIVVIYGEYFTIPKCRVSGFYIKNAMYPLERLEEMKDELIKVAKEFFNE